MFGNLNQRAFFPFVSSDGEQCRDVETFLDPVCQRPDIFVCREVCPGLSAVGLQFFRGESVRICYIFEGFLDCQLVDRSREFKRLLSWLLDFFSSEWAMCFTTIFVGDDSPDLARAIVVILVTRGRSRQLDREKSDVGPPGVNCLLAITFDEDLGWIHHHYQLLVTCVLRQELDFLASSCVLCV